MSDGFWENANCMWCPGHGGQHAPDCKRHVGITDGPSKAAIEAHRAAQPVTEQVAASALVDRIAEVLRTADHLPTTSGQTRLSADRYRRMAQAVAAELNLTEEHGCQPKPPASKDGISFETGFRSREPYFERRDDGEGR